MYKELNSDRVIGKDEPFTAADGTKYPAGWLELLSDEQALALGLEALAPEPVDVLVRDYAQEIKQIRDAKMAGGITLNGVTIFTDDVSQGRITGAALAVTLDPSLVIRWKTASGDFIELGAAQVVGIATAVRMHVQACFDHEEILLAAIAAAEDPETVDLTQGWPS
jgi:hypothetical protein